MREKIPKLGHRIFHKTIFWCVLASLVLLLAALAGGETVLEGLLDADDTRVMREALGAPPEPEVVEEPTREQWFLAHPYAMPPNFTGRAAER